MKKIVLFAITFVFAAAFGVAYAGTPDLRTYDSDWGINPELLARAVPAGAAVSNHQPTLDPLATGKTYDSSFGNAVALGHPAFIEGANAGGLRSAGAIDDPSNGVTDFSGKTYDILDMSR